MNLRGTAALTAAKAYFLLAGYALVFVLTRVLTPEEYGRWVVANGIVSFLSTVLISTALKSVSHHVAAEPERASGIRRSALRLQTIVALAVTAVFAAAAPVIARTANDAPLARALLAAAPIPGLYAVYSVHIGVLNGTHRLSRQAGFDAGFSTLKLVLVGSAAAAGWGAAGACGAFAATVCAVIPFAHLASRVEGDPEPYPWRELVRFSAAALVFETCASASHQFTTLIVQGAFGADAAGQFGAGTQVARVAFQLSVSVAIAAIPTVAASTSERETAGATDGAFRYSLLLAGTLAAVIRGNVLELTPMLVGERLIAAAPVARIATPAYFAFALWFLGASVLVASGRPRAAAAIAAVVLVLESALAALIVFHGERVGLHATEETLDSVAWASLGAHMAGVVLTAIVVGVTTGWRPSWRTARAAVVVALTAVLAAAWKTEGWLVLAECAADAAFALVAAMLLRAFTREERTRILRHLR